MSQVDPATWGETEMHESEQTPEGVREVAEGLWRWTADHPDWRPGATPGSTGDWEEQVGSVAYRTDTVCAFFDAQLPEPADPFWRWADNLASGRQVLALTTIKWHRRSREAFVQRYGAAVSRARRSLPDAIRPVPIRRGGETMFWLPEHRALIPGDRILGAAGGGLRICPDSWFRYLPSRITREELADRLRPLLRLPVELVLVSHGEPVLRDGARALERALG
jgi:hypothetical protein